MDIARGVLLWALTQVLYEIPEQVSMQFGSRVIRPRPRIPPCTHIPLPSRGRRNILAGKSTTPALNPSTPLLFNFSHSKLLNTTSSTNSYWTSSYITNTTNEQYLLISHLLVGPSDRSWYRASALNLANPSNYTTTVTSSTAPVFQPGPQLRATMRTFSADSPVLTFDLTYAATSTALVNGGMGLFAFGSGRTYEWGLPNCVTTGSARINGAPLRVDPARSFTWFDRQWIEAAAAASWTRFELHVAGSRDRLSVWAIDSGEGGGPGVRFATIRRGDGAQLVVPVGFRADYTRQWYSQASGKLYPLDWVVTVGEVGVFRIASIVGDQEIAGGSAFPTAYEGFVTFDGRFEGQEVGGFGVVEIIFSGES
ncbi:predicted protein [Aspergillus terreus NIH2624]|uniref:AttH domain-containing protein n=1 Tax=Aspergillus terreus (strain NIH 2624 / FGSC A1156) TaxID=341663 RepID=Q0CC03_ASPTN|nr:uncharacterized protein ATEG_08781 [Aspergillus terreus NIH2624]EAU30913.1 predicted protein [Aspergillus terreus NIH2624]